MKRRNKYVILGSGPTGLGAAYRLKELGIQDFIVVEKNSHVGGLASSFVDPQGFTWDIGGHVQFSHYRYFDELMQKALGKEGWLHHQRESWAWMEKRWVPYPVQNNIRYLTQDSVWKCLEGIISVYQNPPRGRPANFHEWILATFGQGLAELFMFPYNFKVWAYPPAELAYQWIGERVAVTDLKRVTQNILYQRDDLSWGPNNTFQFPKRGGTGEIWKHVANLIGPEHFVFNSPVQEIHWDQKKIVTGSEEIFYEFLLSTLPLDLFCQKLSPKLPETILDASRQLLHSSSNIVGIGLKGQPPEALRTKCWMYFPENDCPFYRTTVFSNYSPNHVPEPGNYWSLMTETSESPKKPLVRENLVEETIQGCLNTGMIESRDQVVSTWMYTAEYGYPTPSLQRDASLKTILPALDQKGIFSRGRFGAWKYEVSNQDHSLMQGVEWVNRVILDIPETTVFFPEVVNANWGK